MFHTGFQYTPVDSSATRLTFELLNHIFSRIRSWVKVENVRLRTSGSPPSLYTRRQAQMDALCTSRPQQREYSICIDVSFCRREKDAGKILDFPSRALLPGGRGDHPLCRFGNSCVRVRFTIGLNSHQTGSGLLSRQTAIRQDTPFRPHFHPRLYRGRNVGSQQFSRGKSEHNQKLTYALFRSRSHLRCKLKAERENAI